MRRLSIVVLVVLVVLAIGVGIAARAYLHSDGARRQVAEHLQTLYGGPVQVDEADIGVLGDSSLHGLRLYEPGKTDGEPWASVGTVNMDVSALDLARGIMPKALTLTDPIVTLRLDRDGRLLTQLPETKPGGAALPEIHIENGQVTGRQEGRPEMVVKGVRAELRPDGDRLALSGTVSDPYWGDWSLDGPIDRAAGALTATLKTGRADVTQEKLLRLPVVPESVWKEVEAAGQTGVEFTFRHDPREPEANHYRVSLSPSAATITLPTVALHTEQVRGFITVEDGLVTLDKVNGQTLGGRMHADGTLDFRGKEYVYHLVVTANELETDQVPKEWDLPQFLREHPGKLNGHADLTVTYKGGEVHTSGTGEAKVTGVVLGGQPTTIELKLHPTGKGFKLGQGGDDTKAPGSFSGRPRGGALYAPPRGRPLNSFLATTILLQAPAQPAPPTYLEINLNLKDVDLAKLVKDTGLQVPFEVGGRLTMKVSASLPVDHPRDLKAYKASGTATLATFSLSGVDMKDVEAKVRYEDGVLRLEELRGRFVGGPAPKGGKPYAGLVTGSARLGLVPEGDLTADLKLTEIPLGDVLRLAGGTAEVTGAVSGKADLRVPAGRLSDLAAWQGSGQLSSDRIGAYGLALTGAGFTVRVAKGLLTVRDVTGKLEGAPLTGSAEAKLTAPYTYEGKLELAKGDLASVQRLAPEVRPPVAVEGKFGLTATVGGTLRPFTTKVSGTGSGEDVKVDKVSVNSLRFHWATAGDVLKLTDVKAGLYGGEVTGSADVPLSAKQAGKIDVRVDGVDVAALAQAVPAVPLRLEGKVSGTIKGTLPAAAGGERSFDADVDLSAPKLRVQNLPAEKLTGTVSYHKGVGEYHLKGSLLGGTFDLDGRIPPRRAGAPAAPPAKPEPPSDSHLRIRGAQLGRLGEALNARDTLGDLYGRVDLDVDYRLELPGYTPVGTGTLTVTRLRWGDRDIADRLSGDIVLAEGEARLRNLNGDLGGGILRGQVVVRLRDPDRSFFSIALDNAGAARLLAPWPALARNVEGSIDARLRGTLGRAWHGGGDVVLTRGKVFGVEVSEWHVPLSFDAVPARGRLQIEIADTSAQVARGRVSGRASLRLGFGTHLDGSLRFYGVDLRTLMRPLTASTQVGAGQASGRIDFAGHDVRSFDDVTATVEAFFRQTQALQMPVMSQFAPALAPGQSNTTFQSGELRGRLGNGVFRVQQLDLSGNVVNLYAEGSVSTAGRLDLEVIANTKRIGVNPLLLRLLNVPLPTVGPIPLSLVARVTDYLSNQVTYLRVGGTVRSPTYRIEPLPQLTEGAVRFFLGRYNVPMP